MRFLVTFSVRDTLTGKQAETARTALLERAESLCLSGGVDGGVYGDAKGGYLVLDLERPDSLWRMLGEEILNNCQVEAHPVQMLDPRPELSPILSR